MGINTRALRVEAPFVYGGERDLEWLRAHLRLLGRTERQASNVTTWLRDKAAGRDFVAGSTRTRYRQWITAVRLIYGEPPWWADGETPVILEPSVTSSAPEDAWIAHLRHPSAGRSDHPSAGAEPARAGHLRPVH